MPSKKPPPQLFKSRARARSIDGPDELREDEVLPGEFTDTAVAFTPCIPRAEAPLTIQFRCSAKVVRGDTVVVRLPGFKGSHAGEFTLEPRAHPENKDFHDYFHAYWSGESSPKGGPPAQCITLQCRKAIDPETLVIVGVPDAVHIALPDKLAANSPKLKIEGNIRHAEGTKIPKAPILMCSEIKKRPVEDELQELDEIMREHVTEAQLDDDEAQFAFEVTQQMADQIWEAAQEVSELRMGLYFRMDPSVFESYDQCAPLTKLLTDNYLAASKRRIPLALHKEIAQNLGVTVGAVVVLEDALYTIHGSHYPELTRAAILVLRLWTCEVTDVCRLFLLSQSDCIYRDISSAVRNTNEEILGKWVHFIGTLMTCCGKLTHIAPELVPVLYRAVKDVPSEGIQHLLSLKKDAWYVFPNFTQCVTEAKYNDESYFIPDNAVLFEVHNAVDGVEIGDVGQYPEDCEWLLPMFSSFSVVSVEQLQDRNRLTKVVLRMRGSLAGALRDELFPEDQRSLASVVIKKARTDCMSAEIKSQSLARVVYANLQLNFAKTLHPTHAVNMQYLDKFAEVRRSAQAQHAIDSNAVKWQQCIQEAVLTGPDARPAAWDNLAKKPATILEMCFLRQTRATKQFTQDSVVVDFKDYSADMGKGVRHVRRLIGKQVSHPFIP